MHLSRFGLGRTCNTSSGLSPDNADASTATSPFEMSLSLVPENRTRPSVSSSALIHTWNAGSDYGGWAKVVPVTQAGGRKLHVPISSNAHLGRGMRPVENITSISLMDLTRTRKACTLSPVSCSP